CRCIRDRIRWRSACARNIKTADGSAAAGRARRRRQTGRRRRARRSRCRAGAACALARPPPARGGHWQLAAMFARLTHTAPDFWDGPPGILADLLRPVGAAWDAVGRLRRRLSRCYWPPVPVVCVGNLVAGGAGKTPVALALSSWLLDHKFR